MTNILPNENFFDSVSGFYDEMINFQISLENRIKAFKKFITPGIHTAADLGCGTGLDSIALSKLGLKVTGFDISAQMLERAIKNAEEHKCEIDFHKSSLEQIPSEFKNKFDIALSLGNSVANLSRDKLQIAFNKIFKTFKENGKFILQILNFDLIKKKNKRILKISKNNNYTFIRFFDIEEKNFNLNLLSFNSQTPDENKLITTKIYPYKAGYLKSCLKKSGFKNVNIFGNLLLDKYDKNVSNDVIIVAHKN